MRLTLAIGLITLAGLTVVQAPSTAVPFHTATKVRFASPEEAATLLGAAGLGLLDPGEVSGFFEKIGRNTQYIIHHEETMADNFVFAIVEREDLPNPEILARLIEALRTTQKRNTLDGQKRSDTTE
jgi:hypothetical protein